MDRARVPRCMNMVSAYLASGRKAKMWAQANGVNERILASRCAHARGWPRRTSWRARDQTTA